MNEYLNRANTEHKISLERISGQNNVEIKVLDMGMNLPVDSQPRIEKLNPLVWKTIIQFLNAPTVIDKFEDHSQRREFYFKVEDESDNLFKWFETNKLRWNTLYEMLMILTILLPNDEILQSIKDESNNFPVKKANEYDQLDIVDKVIVVKKLTDIIYRLYKLLVR